MALTIEDLVRDLAAIKLEKFGVGYGESMDELAVLRDLVTNARILEKETGPKMRSRSSAQHADDYQAVAQLAIAIDRDGKLLTSRRLDCEPQAAIPLMAAIRNITRGMDTEAAKLVDLSPADYEKAVDIIDRGMLNEDYFKATGDIVDGSRTNEPKYFGPNVG